MVKLSSAAVLYYLMPFTQAQSSNSSSEEECKVVERYYNSSGTIPFEVNGQSDPWQLSVGMTDLRSPDLVRGRQATEQSLAMFLSVPKSLIGSKKGNNTKFCAYVSGGQNATSEGSGTAEDSCKGVLSDKCIEELTNVMLPQGGGDCPSLFSTTECKSIFPLRTTRPMNFSTPPCMGASLPDINLPDDYETYNTIPSIVESSDRKVDSFDVYDLRVNQSNPVLITVWNGATGEAKLMCLAANIVAQGSRVPEAAFPPSGGMSLHCSGILIAGVVGLTLLINSVY